MTSAVIPPVLLASASRTRYALLSAAGVPVSAVPVDLDEQAIKVRLRADGVDAGDIARALARAKALAVAQRRPDALVIGADQMLVCQDDWYDKPRDIAAARQQLRSLSGKTHRLLTAVVVVQETQALWGHLSQAAMTMRPLSETFLDDYLTRSGSALLSSVGAYQLEGLGAQLFERIEGDHFTILGLPLLPLLDFLRRHGVIKT
jgi:septum formation protein